MANWKKISEKLPQPMQNILVTINDQDGTPMVKPCVVIEDERIQFGEGDSMKEYSLSIVTAWMPFPKPFQEKQQLKQK